jgi:capsular polysaccharide biosynthesis protein
VTLATDRPVLCVPSSGYFHVVLESLPAVLRVAERGDPFDILVWSGAPAYVRELAELLQQGADAGEIVEASGPVRARRVRVAGRTALSGHFDDLDLARLRTFGNRTSGLGARAATERIFVTRTGASRILGNEADVAEHLVRSGFAVVDPGRHPIPEQITMFKGARTVVGAHGGGLTNLAWCPAGTAVVEIFRPERNLDCYARLSHLAGLRYRPQATTSSGHVDLADLSSALRELTCG